MKWYDLPVFMLFYMKVSRLNYIWICSRTSNLEGSVLINGKERSQRRFRKMSCYIMQDDCLSPHLSVMEAMTVSANLKIGKSVSHSDKKAIINEVLEILGTLMYNGQLFHIFTAIALSYRSSGLFEHSFRVFIWRPKKTALDCFGASQQSSGYVFRWAHKRFRQFFVFPGG